MVDWLDRRERPPQDGEQIDVWMEWLDPATGKYTGGRLANCWVHFDRVMHGRHGVTINNFTYWMLVPEDPRGDT